MIEVLSFNGTPTNNAQMLIVNCAIEYGLSNQINTHVYDGDDDDDDDDGDDYVMVVAYRIYYICIRIDPVDGLDAFLKFSFISQD